jgi:YfiR/HmsC-like
MSFKFHSVGLATIALLWALPVTTATAEIPEYSLKAAFLYNFAVFTEWPTHNKEFNLCIIGKDPFGQAIEEVAKKQMQGRAVKLTHLAASDSTEIKACDLMFIAYSEHPQLNRMVGQLTKLPILTIAEANGFDHKAVMILMKSEQNKIAFEINQTAAKAAGLDFSSKLLHLAKSVY